MVRFTLSAKRKRGKELASSLTLRAECQLHPREVYPLARMQ